MLLCDCDILQLKIMYHEKQHNFVFLLFYLQKIKCIVSVHYVISEGKKFSTNVQQTLHKKR